IDAIHGHAVFTGPGSLRVGDRDLESRHVLIATGAAPVPLGIPGEEHLTTSERFMEQDSLPPRIVMVGGGYIASEFSHLAARAGAAVTILQRGERLLPLFDPDLVQWSMPGFHEVGIDVRTEVAVTAVERTGGGFVVRGASPQGTVAVEAD